MTEKKDLDMSLPAPASSVVMKAIDATTFSDMESFVKDLESRPIERLLKDLPNLAKLPPAKVSLVSYVISGKYRQADDATRATIKESIQSTVNGMDFDEQRQRVAQLLERLR
jgi:hypothetical protein